MAQMAQRRNLRVHARRAEDDVCTQSVEVVRSDVQHSSLLLELQHLTVELFTRRFVARTDRNPARQQHPDERPVAHADAEHCHALARKGLKIL